MPSPRADLLDALALPVLGHGEYFSPSAALRAMVAGRSLPFGAAANEAAILAAGTYLQLLRLLSADLGPMPEPGRRRFDRLREKGAHEAMPEQLVFTPVPGPGRRPAFRTHAFLSALPTDFVASLVRLVPPVVAPLPDDPERFAVLGNVLSGVLATRCLAGQVIPVRRLAVATGPRWAPTDLMAWAMPRLDRVVANHRWRIARLAPDLAVAELLTGASRATVARYRSAWDGCGTAFK